MGLKKRFMDAIGVIIFFCMLLLMPVVQEFEQRQQLLILESNGLLTEHHIIADQQVNQIWSSQIKASDRIWLMADIGMIEHTKVMAFYASGFQDLKLPVKEGKCFSENDNFEAVVGYEVATEYKDGMEFFKYDQNDYRVIGKIGLLQDSPLKNTALINNSKYLKTQEMELCFDGPDANQIEWLKGTEGSNQGVERWFDMAHMVGIVQELAGVMMVCSVFLWVYYFNMSLVLKRELCVLAGMKQPRILWNEIRRLSGLFLVCAAVIFLMLHILDFSVKIAGLFAATYVVLILLHIFLFLKHLKVRKMRNE